MALQGRIEAFGVLDCLQFVLLIRQSGILYFGRDAKRTQASLYLHRGSIIRALSPQMSNMRRLLREQGHVDEATLQQALRLQELSEGKLPLGAVLVNMGIIPPQVVRVAVVKQIEQVVSGLVGWKSGLFSFHTVDHQSPDGILVGLAELALPGDINPDHLLMEAARLYDERKKPDRN